MLKLKSKIDNFFFQAVFEIPSKDESLDPSKSTYALKLVQENQDLKDKLSQLEATAPVCFHGKNLPPSNVGPSCNNSIRTCIEESHAHFMANQQNQPLKCVLNSARIKAHAPTTVHGPSFCDKLAQKKHHQMDQQHSVRAIFN